MLLALDLGNTNITFGVFKNNNLILESRMATDKRKMEDQYAVEIHDIIKLHGVSTNAFSGAIISSVVPPLDKIISRAVTKITNCKPIFVGPGTKTGIDIKIDNPAQLGADFIVGAVAAITQFGPPCIVWDLGTATKMCVVDKNKVLRGCVITAGLETSVDALATNSAMLPFISLDAPKNIIGKNTIEAMQSGIVYGTASMIDGMSKRVEEELGYKTTLVATGGLGKEVTARCKRDVIYSPSLLLEGLKYVYDLNNIKTV